MPSRVPGYFDEYGVPEVGHLLAPKISCVGKSLNNIVQLLGDRLQRPSPHIGTFHDHIGT